MAKDNYIEDFECECFPPTCPDCGGQMGWSGDFTLMECGYVQEDCDEEHDGIVHTCSCECDCSADFIQTEDGVFHLLSMTIPNPDDEDDQITQYTKFAEAIANGVPYNEVKSNKDK